MDPPTLFVDVPYIQQQRRLVDCGVFAIAFAVHLALGDDVTRLNFNQGQMRKHLLKCFQEKVMCHFHKTRPTLPVIPFPNESDDRVILLVFDA